MKLAAPSTETPVVLSAKVTKAIASIEKPFAAYTLDISHVFEARKSLAPKFMRACGLWQAETGGNFVAFVRVLDPTVPESREGYRAHSSYMAADHLRRLAGQSHERAEEEQTGPSPVTPLEGMARIIAGLLPLVGSDTEAVWKSFASALHWSDAQIGRLQKLVNESEPLLQAHIPRKAVVKGKRAPLLTLAKAA